MQIEQTKIDRCDVFNIDRFEDERGYFQEIFNEATYSISAMTPQVSLSKSHCDVLRGLHISPYSKLCTCVRGRLWDVLVDLRWNSKTYGQWFGTEISEENHKQIYIPPYCAHGFLSLEDDSTLLYLQGGRWTSSNDKGVKWNDCQIGIQWPLPVNGKYLISEKDQNQMTLAEYEEATKR
jgi:dTDP-4-dehydrorhamnose 3,5-epimerase